MVARSALLPALVGLAVAAITIWVWGGLDRPPAIHDEASYLLQAQIFATGHLVGPSPPHPRFFDQFHVIVEPVLASKYPPLYALTLVPGVLLGLPGLIPVVEAGLSAALAFVIARRIAGTPVALLAMLLYALFREGLTYRSAYYSHSTSELAWLYAVWCALRGGPRAWLGVAVGLGAVFLARPLTAIGLAPATLWLAWSVRPPRRYDVATGIGVVGVCVGLTLGWDFVVSGHPFTPSWTWWARQYLPGDGLGFGWHDGHPLIPYDADRARLAAVFEGQRATYVPARLPAHLWQRLVHLWLGWFGEGQGQWGVPVVIGLVSTLTPQGRLVRPLVAAWIGLFAVHIVFPHEIWLLRYYREAEIVPALVAAQGPWVLGQHLARQIGRRGQVIPIGLLMLAAVSPFQVAPRLITAARDTSIERLSIATDWRAALASLPGDRHLVFVRYAPDHNVHRSLIANEGDLAHARVWTVNDRGGDNAQLQALAPDRHAWLYDEATRQFTPLAPVDQPPQPL